MICFFKNNICLFRNWKVRYKLFACFGLMLIFLFMLTIYALFVSGKVQKNAKQVAAVYLLRVQISSSLHKEFLSMQHDLAHFGLQSYPELLSEMKLRSDKVRILIAELRELTSDGSREALQIGKLVEIINAYETARMQFFSYLKSVEKDSIQDEVMKLHSFEKQIESIINELQREDYVDLSESLLQIYRLNLQFKIVIICLFAVMLFLGIFVSINLTKDISFQITQLMDGTRRISERDFTYQIPSGSQDDEFGSLINSFNWMARHLQETTVSKAELEKAVVSLEFEIDVRKKAEGNLRHNYFVQGMLNSFLRVSLEDLSLEEILDSALGMLVTIPFFNFEAKGAIFLVNGQNLVMKAQKNLPPYLSRTCAYLPFGKCHCGMAAVTKKTQFVSSITEGHVISYEGMQPHGHYCIPILFGEELLGVLNMYVPPQEQYDQKVEEFLNSVMNIFSSMIVRKRAEEALKKSEANLSLAQHLARMGSWEWRPDIDEFFWSSESSSLFDRKFSEMPRKLNDLINIITDDDRKNFTDFFNGVMAEHRKFFKTEFSVMTAAGKVVYLRIEGSLEKKLGAEGVIQLAGTIRDITFQKEVEKSQRLVQLGILVARVAHEVNNPLMVVSGHAQLALMEDIKDPELKRDLEIIVKECDRAKYIIQRLLSFSKPSNGTKEATNINAAIDDIVQLLEHQFSLENVSIKRNYGQGLPVINIDKKGIQEVISNLLHNAQEAIALKGEIEITTVFENGVIRIEIKDNGSGMSEEVMNKVFDPFFSTKPMGTGLGLSVSYNIIKTIGGELSFKSSSCNGTTAIIAIPAEKC